MTDKNNVKRLYGLFNAGWYNTFRSLWTRLFSDEIEQKFIHLLRKHVNQRSRILELGCGTGINIRRLKESNSKFGKYTGLDFSPDMLKKAIKKYGYINNVSLLRQDITKASGENKYDIIISSWVLSHLPSPSKVVNAWYSHLDDNGVMLLLFLTRPTWYINFWFAPLMKLFSAKCIDKAEITDMKGKKEIITSLSGLITLMKIKKQQKI